jgi:DNA-binding winged helix-turn-helix (wHTH) protein
VTESSQYLKSLGFGSHQSLAEFSHIDFSHQEKVFLNTLLEKSNEIVSFNNMANSLWQDQADEKYSLYSMAKIAQKVRQKLKDNGINRTLVYTLRKQGYLFKS